MAMRPTERSGSRRKQLLNLYIPTVAAKTVTRYVLPLLTVPEQLPVDQEPDARHLVLGAAPCLLLEMFRRTLTEADSASAVLDRMLNRLTKIAAELRKLATD